MQLSGSTTGSAIIAGIDYVISRADLRFAVMLMSFSGAVYDPNLDQINHTLKKLRNV